MKKIKTILLFLFISTSCFFANAQESTADQFDQIILPKNEVSLYHNWTQMGRDIELSYTLRFKSFGIKLGLNYFQNSPILDNQNFLYKNRFRALEPIQHFGLNLEYNFQYHIPYSDVILVPYIKAQYFKLGIQNEFANQTILINKMNVLTTTTGLEAKTRLYQDVYLKGAVGSGILWVMPSASSGGSFIGSRYNWEFLVDFRIGLSYHF